MPEYEYRGFTVHYEAKPQENSKHLYEASGYLIDPENNRLPLQEPKFHTAYPTREGVISELKKIIEKYIDFEHKEFQK